MFFFEINTAVENKFRLLSAAIRRALPRVNSAPCPDALEDDLRDKKVARQSPDWSSDNHLGPQSV
jgi:hypothetical protein